MYEIEESDEYFKSVQQSQGRLAGEISRWIVSSNGTDSNDRLEANVRDGIDDIAPSDSISNVGSRADSKHSRTSRRSRSSSVRSKESTTSSVLSARAAAKRAMLEAEATKFEDWQALKKEELALQLKRKALELQTEIAKAQAEELAYAQAENDGGKSITKENNTSISVTRAQQHLTTDSAQDVKNAQTAG